MPTPSYTYVHLPMSKTDVYVLLEYFVNEQTVDTTMATVQAVEANITQQAAEIVWIVKFTTSVLNKLALVLIQTAQVVPSSQSSMESFIMTS